MASPPPDPIRVVGAPRQPFWDVYHAFLRTTWPSAIGWIVTVWLALNALFACAYRAVGGVANMGPHWRDAFYFSVQTMGTIGYGVMAPQSDAAHLLVVLETVTGLIVTAISTGLIFAKFGRTTTRVVFSRRAAIGPHDGVPTLMIRVGNERANRIVDARFEVTLVRTERTREGVTFYRMYDLVLARNRTASLQRMYTILHPIDEKSPLRGYDAERFRRDEAELHVVVTGLDDTTLQPIHALHTYLDADLAWGARPADVLSELPDGTLVADASKFHEIVQSTLSEDAATPPGEDGEVAASEGKTR